jgi:L-seryl-tRNA(Ser) seleniumtransferase
MVDFRRIPSIDKLRQQPSIRALEQRFGAAAVVEALRTGATVVRESLASGDMTLQADSTVLARIEAIASSELERGVRSSLQPVINATGVILHTNLGRAPLADAALDRIIAIARGYSSLEYDVSGGQRGRRDAHTEPVLCRLTGAEAALVVNNNAAGTMLVLASIAAGREVIVSRGELVEIGGGFRVPDVMAQSGALLREVGTTNKTRAADYAAAIGDRTALILRVHPSNFRIEGFTERPSLAELVDLGKRFKVPIAEDLGSGQLLTDPPHPLVGSEPSVHSSVSAGVDVCCFSGDKLLGGPQAGVIVGRKALVDRVRRHPLMRALRADKLTHAALEATLIEYAAGRANTTVPVQRMLTTTAEEIRIRAAALAAELVSAGLRAEVIAGFSAVGGGSAPGVDLPTWLIALEKEGLSASALEEQLRGLHPAVIARIDRDRVVLDLRTVLPHQDAELSSSLRRLQTREAASSSGAQPDKAHTQ